MIDLNGKEVSEAVEEVLNKPKKIGLFDFVNDLTSDKKYLFEESTEKEFNSFMINRALGQQPDLIMYANEMNKNPGLSREMVHDFYFYVVKAKKRYGKWSKASDDNKEILELIKTHYCVNNNVAEQYLKLLTTEDIENLKKMNSKGGKSK